MKNDTQKRMRYRAGGWDQEIVFMPALTPLEAAMIPAQEPRRAYGALAHARRAFEWTQSREDQRQKIWVR